MTGSRVRGSRARGFGDRFGSPHRERDLPADGHRLGEDFAQLLIEDSEGDVGRFRHEATSGSRSRLPSAGVLPAMHGQDNDAVAGHAEVHRVRKPVQDRTPRFCSHQSKLHRVVGDAFDRFVQRRPELGAKPRPPTFVPVSRFQGLRFGLGTKADTTIHSRSINFRRTSSQGIEDSGRWTCSIQRRSSSAAASGVNSSSPSRSASERLSHRAMASSARSPAGSFRRSESEGDILCQYSATGCGRWLPKLRPRSWSSPYPLRRSPCAA